MSIPQAAWAAANSPSRTAELTYRNGRDAELSTEVVEGFGIKEKISEFTTYHNCCEARVINIQRIADEVDGAWVLPGQVWSLNDHVGKRTVADGYVCAGALIRGEVVQEGEICIGGGTSQFTTTLYNAIFFAGLEDVYHFAHTIWFSRYPEGREATLGFPGPDLIFRNNTDSVVVIKTSHTDTSITVKMFGDNGDILVEAGLSDRFNYTLTPQGHEGRRRRRPVHVPGRPERDAGVDRQRVPVHHLPRRHEDHRGVDRALRGVLGVDRLSPADAPRLRRRR